MENTDDLADERRVGGDHFHIRGEYPMNPEYNVIAIGSPPHTWRIRWSHEHAGCKKRITSTYVENTPTILALIVPG